MYLSQFQTSKHMYIIIIMIRWKKNKFLLITQQPTCSRCRTALLCATALCFSCADTVPRDSSWVIALCSKHRVPPKLAYGSVKSTPQRQLGWAHAFRPPTMPANRASHYIPYTLTHGIYISAYM